LIESADLYIFAIAHDDVFLFDQKVKHCFRNRSIHLEQLGSFFTADNS